MDIKKLDTFENKTEGFVKKILSYFYERNNIEDLEIYEIAYSFAYFYKMLSDSEKEKHTNRIVVLKCLKLKQKEG